MFDMEFVTQILPGVGVITLSVRAGTIEVRVEAPGVIAGRGDLCISKRDAEILLRALGQSINVAEEQASRLKEREVK